MSWDVMINCNTPRRAPHTRVSAHGSAQAASAPRERSRAQSGGAGHAEEARRTAGAACAACNNHPPPAYAPHSLARRPIPSHTQAEALGGSG